MFANLKPLAVASSATCKTSNTAISLLVASYPLSLISSISLIASYPLSLIQCKSQTSN